MKDPLLFPSGELFEPGKQNVPAPEGWTPSPFYDPFEAYIGPMFHRADENTMRYGIVIDERHCDDNGNCELGLLMTFADATLGWEVWRDVIPDFAITISQNTEFLGTVPRGSFVTCAPQVTRKTRQIVFVKGLYSVDGEPVMSASSLWKVVEADS